MNLNLAFIKSMMTDKINCNSVNWKAICVKFEI